MSPTYTGASTSPSSGVTRGSFECETSTARDVPVLGPPGHGAQRPLLATTTDDDRRVRLLHGLGLVVRIHQLVVLALEVGGRLREQLDDDFHGFVEPVEPLAQRRQFDAVR